MKDLSQYSPIEKAVFEHMHKTLEQYNRAVAIDPSLALDKPMYEPELMAAYSQYQELLAQKEADENKLIFD